MITRYSMSNTYKQTLIHILMYIHTYTLHYTNKHFLRMRTTYIHTYMYTSALTSFRKTSFHLPVFSGALRAAPVN